MNAKWYHLLLIPYELLKSLGLIVCLLLFSTPADMSLGQELPVTKFPLPRSPIELTRSVQRGKFFSAIGRRAMVLGFEEGTFESWVYPLKLFHDCRMTIAVEGGEQGIEFGSIAERITVRPESSTITGSHSLFTIHATFFTPLNEAGSILLLDADTARSLTLTVSFIPDLKPMWPGGLGGQYAFWNGDLKAFVISESRRKYNGLIGSPFAIGGSSTPAHERPKAVSFQIQVDPEAARASYVPIVIVGGMNGREAAVADYKKLLTAVERLYEQTREHYQKLRENTLAIETPDRELNLAFEWARVSLDKGLASNPDLGTGLVAGFGVSGEHERPGFAWYFGGDAFINSLAITSYGDFDTVKQAFSFLQKRQRQDGKMMHELSQSAGMLRWFEEFPYGYYHGDTTPLYIVAFQDYYEQSGDIQFLRESWPSLVKAYRYCLSTDEDGDGLMDNTKAGLGASELGSLLEDLKTDIFLAALSVQAMKAMAALAEVMSEPSLRDEAAKLSEKGRKSLNERFWNDDLKSLIHALTVSGGQNTELTAWPAVAMMFRLIEETKAAATLDMLASAHLSTDWGVRMLSSISKAYDPVAYNNGAVWPFLTGFVSLAEYEHHRARAAYEHLKANVGLTFAEALGSHPELLSGDYYRPLETAVPQQLFSSSMIISPLVRGLLGLRGEAAAQTLTFAPHLPPEWDRIKVERYRVGAHLFTITFEKETDRVRLEIRKNDDETFRVKLGPAFAPLTKIRSLIVNGENAPFDAEENEYDVHCRAAVTMRDRLRIEIHFQPGVEIIVPTARPSIGDRTSSLKIVNAKASKDTINIIVEGISGQTYSLFVHFPGKLLEVKGARLASEKPILKELSLSFASISANRYVRQEVVVRFAQ